MTKFRSALFELSTDLLCVLDTKGNVVGVNTAWAETLGWPQSELLHRPLAEFIHESDRGHLRRMIERTKAGDHVLTFEVRLTQRTGAWRPLNLKLAYDPDSQNHLIVARDIAADLGTGLGTGFDMADYERFFEGSVELFCLIGIDGRIKLLNPALTRLTGYDAEELRGRHVLEFLHPEDRDATVAGFKELQESAALPREFVSRWLMKNGNQRYLSWRMSPYRSHRWGDVYYCYGLDMTERHLQAESLSRSRKMLTEAQVVGKVGHWDYDPGSDKIVWSKEIFNIFEIEAACGNEAFECSISGREFMSRIHPEDRDALGEHLRSVAVAEGPSAFEYRILTPRGAIKWLLSTGRPHLGKNGEITRFSGTTQEITQLKKLEQERAETHAIFSQIFNESAIGMALLDRDGRFMKVNNSLCRMLGYSGAELCSKSVTGITYSEDLKKSARAKRPSDPDNRGASEIELRYVRKDGALIWVRVSQHTHQHPITKENYSVATIEDVTEAHLMRKRLDRIVNVIPGMVFQSIMRANGYLEFLYVSNGVNEILGRPPSEIVGDTAVAISHVHADDLPQLQQTIVHSNQTLTPWEWSGRVVIQGRVKWLQGLARPEKQENGDILWDGLLIDVTESKEAELELHAIYQRQNLHVQHTPLGVIEFNLDGKVVHWNAAAEQIFGYKRNEIVGRHWTTIVPPGPTEKEVDAVWKELVAHTGGQHVRTENLTKDGRVIACEWYNTVLRDAGGRTIGIASLVHDVSAQIEAERTIEEQRLKIVASSKLSALGEMAAGIAHEINNPLAVIYGKAQQLEHMVGRGELDPGKVTEQAVRIEKMADRIAKIVRGLRAFARDGSEDPFESKPLKAVIDDTLEFCLARFRNHDVEVRLAPIPEEVVLDCRAVQLSQVFLNLLNNAFDAIAGLDEKWIAIVFKDRGDEYEVSVEDSGRGIPEEIANKIMQPFFTTKELGKGTGLGLSISSGLIESHGGRLFLDRSAPRTRFVVVLPKRQKPAAAA